MASLRHWFLGVTVIALTSVTVHAEDDMTPAMSGLESRWVDIRYHTQDKTKKLEGSRLMAADAGALAAQYPGKAGPLVWQALALLVEAEVRRDLSVMDVVKQAKALLEKAESLDAPVMGATIQTTLGALYYEMPGWPVGFGDNKKAAEYLTKALALNPDGIDPNYFYGDYLLQRGKGREAVPYLEKALHTSPRPDHEGADKGRLADIQEALDAARKAR